VTGGVITSAGIVLAGTFLVPRQPAAHLPHEIGFVVAFGVLLDTFLVRSIMVPAIALDLGDKFWWPSSLSRRGGGAEPAQREREPAAVGSENRQEVLDLVRGHLDPVLVPFLPLDLDEAAEGVLAERPQDRAPESAAISIASPSVSGSCSMPRWARSSARGGRGSAPSAPAARSPSRSPRARLQHAGEAEVGVAGGVGAAQLGPGRPLLAGVVERHPDQRRAVAARPGEVDGRLVARHRRL
jgi:hypothetical protein